MLIGNSGGEMMKAKECAWDRDEFENIEALEPLRRSKRRIVGISETL